MQTENDSVCALRAEVEALRAKLEEKEQGLQFAKGQVLALQGLVGQGKGLLFWLVVDERGVCLDGETIDRRRWNGRSHDLLQQVAGRRWMNHVARRDVVAQCPAVASCPMRHTELPFLESEAAIHALQRLAETGDTVHFTDVVHRVPRGDVWQVRLVPVAVPLKNGAHRLVIGVAEEIGKKQSQKNQMREAVLRYRRLLDMMPDAVSIIDTNGQLRYVNAAGKQLLGADASEEIVGRSYWDFVHPEDTEDLRTRANALKRGEPLTISEYRMLRMDGSVVPVELASVPITYNGKPAVLGTGRDLSNLRCLQEELLRVRHAVESMDDAVAIFHADGTATYHNPAFRKMIGFSVEALNQEGGFQRLFFDESIGHEICECLAKGNHWRGDVDICTAANHVQPMELRANVVFDDQRRPIGVVCICSDATARQEEERELRAAKEEAEEIARLRSAILTNLTHEVRTPLTVILGFTSMLRQGVREKYARFVDLIERSGRRLLLMLDAILDLAQLESGSLEIVPESFNVVDVADGVVGTLESVARDKGIALHLEAEEHSIPARLDHRVLARILNNLLDNAIKFTNDGSVRVQVRRDGAWVEVNIIDTGVGIDESFLPYLFKEFTQESTGLERTHQGSGLGLAVSERLVTYMGGRIDVASEKDNGTSFTIRLPANMDAPE